MFLSIRSFLDVPPTRAFARALAACAVLATSTAAVAVASSEASTATPAGAVAPEVVKPEAAPAPKERRVVAKVDGMVCGMCVQSITKKLEETGKVTRVKVDLKGKTVEFGLKDGATIGDDEIRKALEAAGYSLTGLTREG